MQKCKCQRCGYEWRPRIEGRPKCCPRCKSYTWDQLTAEQAIVKIKSVKTKFMGQSVNKHNYQIEIRSELQKMAESGELSPAEYNRALKLTWPHESESLKAAEFEKLNK